MLEIPENFKLEVSIDKTSILVLGGVIFFVVLVAVAIGASIGKSA